MANKNSFLEQRISRREFIKKTAMLVGGLAIGAHTLNELFLNKRPSLFSQAFRNDVPDELWKWSKEAYHYKKLANSVQCQLCPNECVLGEGDRGFCRVRVYKDNKLYTLAYGNPCSVHVDPIEKKPLYHYLPTTGAFSIATAGCNFRCLNCQNWSISQFRPEDTQNYDLMPESVVLAAQQNNCQSIAYTYSEPSVFYEYMLDTSILANNVGIKNLWITNGYMNEKPLREFCKYLGAANVDLKGFDDNFYIKVCSGRRDPVLRTLKILKEEKRWFEVTNLMVPTLSDDLDKVREMSQWLYKNIGADYPLHFSRFHPQYKLTHLPPTPVEVLESGRKIAMDEGVKFVYIGNVPGHEAQNTYCPKCGKIVIEREGYNVDMSNFENGACKSCGEEINGIWNL